MSLPAPEFMVSSSTGTDGGGNVPDPAAPYSIIFLYGFYVAFEVVMGAALGALFWRMPARLLAQLSARVLGFELVQECVSIDDADDTDDIEGATHMVDRPLLEEQQPRLQAAGSSSSSSARATGNTVVSSGPDAPARVVTKSVHGKVRIMFHVVALDAIDTSDPYRHRRDCGARLLSFLLAWVPSPLRHRPLSVLCSRMVRRALWFNSLMALVYLALRLDGGIQQVTLPDLTPAQQQQPDFRQPCPVVGMFCFNTYDLDQSVPCYTAGNTIDPSIHRMICYSHHSLSVEEVLSALSSMASLFLLVFGGFSQALCWVLPHIKSRRGVYGMGIGFTAIVLAVETWQWSRHTGNTLLSLFVPFGLLVSALCFVRIRLAQMEVVATGRLNDDCVMACVRRLGCEGCFCCVGAGDERPSLLAAEQGQQHRSTAAAELAAPSSEQFEE